MSRSVSLPMYAVPAEALASFWQGLRHHMRREGLADVPDSLDTPSDLKACWLSPDLLLGQTCGYPLVTNLAGRVRYVGTPCYRAVGCAGPFYSSAVVVRANDPALDLPALAGRRVAFNGHDSQSGMNGLRALVAPLAVGGRFFAEAIETGAHRLSIAAIRQGTADVAAIDAVTLTLLARADPAAVEGLRIVAHTEKVPGLPLITAATITPADVERLRAAWTAVCADPGLAASRDALLLDGFEVLPPSSYDVIAVMRDRAAALGYPELA